MSKGRTASPGLPGVDFAYFARRSRACSFVYCLVIVVPGAPLLPPDISVNVGRCHLCGGAGALPSTRKDARALDPFFPSGGTRRVPGGGADRRGVRDARAVLRPLRGQVWGYVGLGWSRICQGAGGCIFAGGGHPPKISTGKHAPLTIFTAWRYTKKPGLDFCPVPVYNSPVDWWLSRSAALGVRRVYKKEPLGS